MKQRIVAVFLMAISLTTVCSQGPSDLKRGFYVVHRDGGKSHKFTIDLPKKYTHTYDHTTNTLIITPPASYTNDPIAVVTGVGALGLIGAACVHGKADQDGALKFGAGLLSLGVGAALASEKPVYYIALGTALPVVVIFGTLAGMKPCWL